MLAFDSAISWTLLSLIITLITLIDIASHYAFAIFAFSFSCCGCALTRFRHATPCRGFIAPCRTPHLITHIDSH